MSILVEVSIGEFLDKLSIQKNEAKTIIGILKDYLSNAE